MQLILKGKTCGINDNEQILNILTTQKANIFANKLVQKSAEPSEEKCVAQCYLSQMNFVYCLCKV